VIIAWLVLLMMFFNLELVKMAHTTLTALSLQRQDFGHVKVT